jgi:hypothetical protein
MLAKYTSSPGKQHVQVLRGLLAYLKGTIYKGIVLGKRSDDQLVAFADSDWAQDPDDRCSVSGGVLKWGDSVIHWFSRKQGMICTSTAEAESHAMLDMSYDIISAQRLIQTMGGFFGVTMGKTVLYTDNLPAMQAILNKAGRTKHYDIRFKFIGQCVLQGVFEIRKIASVDNLADALTKPLRAITFRRFSQVLLADTYFIGQNLVSLSTDQILGEGVDVRV